MKDLFYSESEKRIFFIAGYTDNSYNVREIIGVLENNRKFLLKHIGLPEKSTIVNTGYITTSKRYKSMRYFWIDNIEKDEVPEDAFWLNNEWKMHEWLEN